MKKLNNKKLKHKKLKHKSNKRRLIIIVVIIIGVIFIFNNNSNNDSEIVYASYDVDLDESVFIEKMDKIQNEIGVYLITNTSLDSGSFSNIIKDVNSNLKKNDFSFLNLEDESLYAGKYSVDEDGNLKFKFKSKKVEPKWAINNKYIILN